MTDLICGVRVSACWCCLTPDHPNNHECSCGGQWTGSDVTGDFKAKRLPQRGPLYDSGMSSLLDLIFGDPT